MRERARGARAGEYSSRDACAFRRLISGLRFDRSRRDCRGTSDARDVVIEWDTDRTHRRICART